MIAKRSHLSALVLGAMAVMLAGCAGFEGKKTADRVHREVQRGEAARAETILAKQATAAKVPDLVEDVLTPFTGGSQIVTPRNTHWPVALRRESKVDMLFSDNVVDSNGNVIVPIGDFGQKVHLVTGIPVRVKPDALLDEAGKTVSVTIPSKFSGSLPQLFDQLAARYRVYAQYENGELEFYRMATRRFMIGAAASTSGGSMTIDSGGAASGDGGFSASASLKSTFADIDGARTLITGVRQWMSKGAPEPVYNAATGSLTVTDTPEVLEKVAEYIDAESRLMRRGVIFDVDVIRFSSKRNGQSGVNWNLVYQRVRELNTMVNTLRSPPSPLSSTGTIGGQVQGGTQGQNRFAGSSLLLQALNESGSATIVRHTTLETVNRVGVMHAINKTFDYVNEVSASTTLSGVAVGQKTKTENVGRTLLLVPALNNEIEATVDISVRESVKNPFGRNTSGSGQSQTTVQLLDKDTEVARQRVTLNNGESRVLAAITGRTTEGNEQTLDANLNAFFGGSVTGRRDDDQFYLVVTMRFKE